MDILEFAMQMELDGISYYEQHAANEPNKELKEILLTLAAEEEKHFTFFKKMKDGEIEVAEAQIDGSSKTLEKVNNIFAIMAEKKEKASFGDEVIAVWKEALNIEQKAESFYRDKAKSETDPKRQKLLDLIADEERTHIHMIDGVLTYLRYPEAFGESAQFKNFRSLEGH